MAICQLHSRTTNQKHTLRQNRAPLPIPSSLLCLRSGRRQEVQYALTNFYATPSWLIVRKMCINTINDWLIYRHGNIYRVKQAVICRECESKARDGDGLRERIIVYGIWLVLIIPIPKILVFFMPRHFAFTTSIPNFRSLLCLLFFFEFF